MLGGKHRKILGDDSKGRLVFSRIANGSPESRAAARRVQARSTQRAADPPDDKGHTQAAGVITLRAIAGALNAQNIPIARGNREWSATQVWPVMERLDPFVASAN
jgi:hypothetical protein